MPSKVRARETESERGSLLLNVNTSNKEYIVKNEIRARQERRKTHEPRGFFACHLFSLGARDKLSLVKKHQPKRNARLMEKEKKRERQRETTIERMLFPRATRKMPKIAGW